MLNKRIYQENLKKVNNKFLFSNNFIYICNVRETNKNVEGIQVQVNAKPRAKGNTIKIIWMCTFYLQLGFGEENKHAQRMWKIN